jgi:competence protein ComGF
MMIKNQNSTKKLNIPPNHMGHSNQPSQLSARGNSVFFNQDSDTDEEEVMELIHNSSQLLNESHNNGNDVINLMIEEHRKIKEKEKEGNMFLIDHSKNSTAAEHKKMCRFAAMLHKST